LGINLFTLALLVEARTRALIRFLIELREDKKTGKVFVTSEGVDYVIHVRDGGVVFAEEPGSEPIGRLMVRKSLLTQEQYVDVLEQVSEALGLGEQLRFGEAAVQLGFVSQDKVRTALEEQIRWRAARVIQRKEPKYRFDDAAPDTDKAHTLSMSVESLILDAIRWMDDERKDGLVLSVAKNFALEATWAAREIDKLFRLSRDEREFLREALRGNCTVQDMCTSEVPDGVDPYALLTAVIVTGAVHTRERTSSADPLERISSPQIDPTPPPAPVIQEKPSDWNAVDSERAKSALAKVQIVRKSSAELKAVDPASIPVVSAETKSLRAETAFQRSRASLKAGAHNLALKAVEEALSLQPESKEYALYAEWLRVVEAGGAPSAEQQTAIETLALAAEVDNPNLAFAEFVRSELQRFRGDDNGAAKHRKHALKLDANLYTGACLATAPKAATAPKPEPAPEPKPQAAPAPEPVPAPKPPAAAKPEPILVPEPAPAPAPVEAKAPEATDETPAREPTAIETAATEPPPPPAPVHEAKVEIAADEETDAKSTAAADVEKRGATDDELPTLEPVDPSPAAVAAVDGPTNDRALVTVRPPAPKPSATPRKRAPEAPDPRRRLVGILVAGLILSAIALALALWVRSTAPSTTLKPQGTPVATTTGSTARPTPSAARANSDAGLGAVGQGAEAGISAADAGTTAADASALDAGPGDAATSDAAAGSTGTVRLPPHSAGRRIYLDGKLWGEAKDTIELGCGKHVMRIGSKGDDRSLVVPCDGSELVLK
jgi:tetratricopeptide (TPR) repeat protein